MHEPIVVSGVWDHLPSFGETLRGLRASVGWTKRDLAQRAQIGERLLDALERDQIRATPALVNALLNAVSGPTGDPGTWIAMIAVYWTLSHSGAVVIGRPTILH